MFNEPTIFQRARQLSLVAVLLASFSSTGCVEHALREGREAMDYGPLETGVIDVERQDGAIWGGSTPSGSFLFFDQKARGVGDLITVLIEENMQAEGRALTELESGSTIGATVSSDVGLASLVALPIRTMLTWVGIGSSGNYGNDGSEVNIIDGNKSNTFDGQGVTERSGRFRGQMTCRVIDVLPDGLMHIRGRRYVVVNHEAQYISIEGLVRREDIAIDNTISSTSIAEARIAYDGLGVVDDKQRPGWLARVFDWVYPY